MATLKPAQRHPRKSAGYSENSMHTEGHFWTAHNHNLWNFSFNLDKADRDNPVEDVDEFSLLED